MKLVRTGVIIFIIFMALIVAIDSFAGAKWGTGGVYMGEFDSGVKYARGKFKGVYNTSNTTEYIYCERYANTDYEDVFCSAKTANNQQLYCFSKDSKLIRAADGLTPSSQLEFRVNDDGKCHSIYVRNGSPYL